MVPTLVVAGAVDAELPAVVVAAAVLGAVVVVLGAVELGAVELGAVAAGIGAPPGVPGAVVAGAALVVLAAGTRSCQCSCSRPP